MTQEHENQLIDLIATYGENYVSNYCADSKTDKENYISERG